MLDLECDISAAMPADLLVFVCDPDMSIVALSPQARALFLSDPVGRIFTDILVPDERKKIASFKAHSRPLSVRLNFLQNAVVGSHNVNLDGRISLMDGGRIMISGFERLNPYEADSQFRAIVETTGEGVLVHANGKIKYLNEACTHILGIDIDGAYAETNPYKYIHPDDRQRILDYHNQRISHGDAPDRFEFRLVRASGEVRWVSSNARLLEMNGEMASLVVMSDVTHLRKLEDAHQESRELFAKIVELIPDFLSISKLSTKQFIFANVHFYELFGYSEADVIGRTGEELKIWGKPEERVTAITEARKGKVHSAIVKGRKRDGTLMDVQIYGALIRDKGDEFFMVIGRDVSRELLYARNLEESREQAMTANRTKSQFLANMSHELRTPLNAIMGFSQFIRDQLFGPIDDKRYVEYANDIYKSGFHLLTIINEILDLSKVESGKLDMKESNVSLRELSVATFNLLRARALEYGVRLINRVPENELVVFADETRLKQSLINVLSNAIKFTPDDGQVSLSAFVHYDGSVVLRVEDTGVGMDEDQVALAFEPFGQVENTYTRPERGTGLGLPLVKAFMDLHQGQVVISSRVGEGTTIDLVLPPERNRS